MAYQYEVRGAGYFPEDMLRYDRAKIVSVRGEVKHMEHGKKGGVYTIESPEKPTEGRWNSFLWSVSNVRKVVK